MVEQHKKQKNKKQKQTMETQETSASVNTENPLDMSFEGLDTSLPKFKAGQLGDFKIVKATAMTNAAKTLKLELESLEEMESDIEGQKLKAGSKLFSNVNTVATGKATPQMLLRGPTSMAAFGQAFKPALTLRNLQENVDQLQGRTLRLRTGIQPAGTGNDGVYRDARAQVAEWIKAPRE